jgi:hypothetical protein
MAYAKADIGNRMAGCPEMDNIKYKNNSGRS